MLSQSFIVFRAGCLNTTNTTFICSSSQEKILLIYGGLTAMAVLLGFARVLLIYYVTVNAARVLHNRMFMAVSRTSVRFFDINPSGKE